MSLIRVEPRALGSLPPVGPLSFGLWRFTDGDPARGQLLIETALDAGMNMIDVADVYGFDWGGTGFGQVEENLGAVLAAAPSLRSACEASLGRLGVDVIDLYQIHRPDMYTHPADVAATLAALRDEGKVREVGISNHTPSQVAALVAHLPFPLVANQVEYSAVHLDPMRDGTLDDCMRLGVLPLAWSPLAGGSLATGEGLRPELLEVVDRLAEREGVDRSQLALAFVLAHPARPVAIVGTQNPDRIGASTAALGVNLTRDDVYAIIQASEGVPLP
jgi:predicted oxidoreductase